MPGYGPKGMIETIKADPPDEAPEFVTHTEPARGERLLLTSSVRMMTDHGGGG